MILRNRTLEKNNFDPNIKKGNSNKFCVVECDFCGKIFERIYHKLLRGRKNIDLDCCSDKKCQMLKRERVFLKKYGVNHPGKNEEIKRKREKTFIKKFGTNNPFSNNEIKQKIKQTNLKKYGVENVAFLESIKLKRKQTNLKKYGVEFPIQNEEIKNKIRKTIKDKYGKNTYGESLQKISYKDIVFLCCSKNYIPLFEAKDYKNRKQKLKFKCNEHNFVFESSIENIGRDGIAQCPKCKICKVSKYEQEIVDFLLKYVNEKEIIRNDRQNIGSELDLYIPNKKLAIEFHGLYWHCNLFKTKKYHYDKFVKCKEKEICLIQIFEDEWRNKRDIVESIILNKLGINNNFKKYHARNLIVNVNPSFEKVKNFFENNHLQGNVRYKKAFSLEENGEIVVCISLRKPFTKKKPGTIEVARFCSAIKSHIPGAFSRLMKYVKEWVLQENFNKILTYSDCSYGIGNVYRNYGFKYVGHSGIGYFYTDYVNRFNRFKYRAKNGKSENEIANENGVCKIFNSGNYIWVLEL